MADSEPNIFKMILKEARERGYEDLRSKEARNWIRERASEVPSVSDTALLSDLEHKLQYSPSIGQMYLFKYDPKYEETLPYYDAFPLIFPIEFTSNGFRGLNLHYLPRVMRAALMDRLYGYNTDTNLDPNARIALSYAALSTFIDLAAFKPCFKRYLFSQVQSRYLKIDPMEWEIALFLPLERFKKASENTIYNDSLSRIRKHRRRLL